MRSAGPLHSAAADEWAHGDGIDPPRASASRIRSTARIGAMLT